MREALHPRSPWLLACVAALLLAATPLLAPSGSRAGHQGPNNGCTSSTQQQGTLVTPAFDLPQSSTPQLSFETFWEIESVAPATHDVMTVLFTSDQVAGPTALETLNPSLSPSGAAADAPVSNTDPANVQTTPAWESQIVSLAALEGHTNVRLHFRFDSGDTLYQGFRGWGIDDVTVAYGDVVFALGPESFEATGNPAGWSFGGLWHVHDNPEDTQILEPDIDPNLITLGSEDAGLLPGDPNGSRIAWFGDGTGTYCGTDFAVAFGVTPGDAVQETGTTLSATLDYEGAESGACVRWRVEGANPRSAQTQAIQPGNGQVNVSYVGANAGGDTLVAELYNQCSAPTPIRQSFGFYSWTAPQEPPPDDPPQQPPPSMRLTPESATPSVTRPHEVVAHTGFVPSSAPIRWSVEGANPASGTAALDPATGQAAISWTGRVPGRDTLTAYADLDGNGSRSENEPQSTATADWQSVLGTDQPIEQAQSIDQLSDPGPGEVNVQAAQGHVFIRLPRGGGARAASHAPPPRGFIELSVAAQVPVGATLDATSGRVSLESISDAGSGATQTAAFSGGRFAVSQTRGRRPVTEMALSGGSFRGCGRAHARRSGAEAARHRRVRRVWGSGRGRFRTRGRYSSATVRGTTWLVEDRCGGTLTRVSRGSVVVRDLVRRRTLTLRAPRSYFAQARR
jgi:hypothetical protein